MKRIVVPIIAAIAIFMIFCSCNKGFNGKYIDMWSQTSDYSFKNGTYTYTTTVENGNKNGTYVVDKNIVTLTDKDNDKETYTIDGKYLINKQYKYTGAIPDTNLFDVTCTKDMGISVLTLKFNQDGTFHGLFNVLNVNGKTYDGIYTRKGEIITVTQNDGNKIELLVKDNLLYDAFKKE